MCDILAGVGANHRRGMRATALLFVFVAVGCERSPKAGAKPAAGSAPAISTVTAAAATSQPPAMTQPASARQASETPRKFIACYFHRTLRCPTCLSIEQQSRDAIEAAYNTELSTGKLEWRAVNIEEPGNEHFEKDFALDRQALTLVELQGAAVQRHTKLERVWDLVDDPYGFQAYVVSEVARFLGSD